MKKMFLGLLLLMATLPVHAQNYGIGQNQSNFPMLNQLDTSMNTAERTYLLNLLEETLSLYNQGTAEISTVQVSFKPGIDRWSVLEVLETSIHGGDRLVPNPCLDCCTYPTALVAN